MSKQHNTALYYSIQKSIVFWIVSHQHTLYGISARIRLVDCLIWLRQKKGWIWPLQPPPSFSICGKIFKVLLVFVGFLFCSDRQVCLLTISVLHKTDKPIPKVENKKTKKKSFKILLEMDRFVILCDLTHLIPWNHNYTKSYRLYLNRSEIAQPRKNSGILNVDGFPVTHMSSLSRSKSKKDGYCSTNVIKNWI